MSEDGPWCGFKRKTVVMSCIGLCCLALVVWTIVITAHTPLPEDLLVMNGTNITNLTQLDVCTYNASEQIEQVKLYLVNDGGGKLARRNLLQKKEEKLTPLCKCYCKLNITEEELMEAVKLLRLNANSAKLPLQNPLKIHKVGFTENNPLQSKQSFITAKQSPQHTTEHITDMRSALTAHVKSADSRPVQYNPQAAYSGPQPVSNMASDEEILSYAGESFSRH